MISAKGSGALVASLLSFVSMPALAQSTSVTGNVQAAAKTGASADEASVDDIVVTGSHIARPEVESAMPVSVIRTEDAKNFGRNTVYDTLLLNPAVGPGLGDTTSGGQEYDAGVANINLRNLGISRTLVLVDGQRWVPGGARSSSVDLNTIPSALIDRAEVVTGGAAAIYGADAVTGAVNIIMKKKLSGIHLSATNGISGHGDARQSDASIATGFDFGEDRGHFVVGAAYQDTAPLAVTDRYNQRPSYYPNPASKSSSDGIPDNLLNRDTRQLNRSFVPAFCLPTLGACGQFYQLIGGVVTAVPQSSYTTTVAGETGAQMGALPYTSNAFENVTLRAKQARATAYAHASYELTPAITWGATLSYAHTYNRASAEWPAYRDDARPTNWWGGTTSEIATLTNPYLPGSLRAFMLANGLTAIPLDRTYLNLPPPLEIHKRDNITVGSDIGGKLTDKLKWQAYARYGQVIDNITTENMVGKNEWLAARNTIVDATGTIVCADAAARAAGCQPLNFFSTDPYSQSLLNYLEHSRYERTKNTLIDTGGNINGGLFSLPYGELTFAAGFEWRRETLSTRDDPDTAKLADIVFSPGADFARHPNLDAKRETAEVYGEAVVPLLKDLPFARRLEIEGAYRYSHYTGGLHTNTWKAGGTWEPVSGLSFRGVYSHSVRIPNFGELFSPVSPATIGTIADPCQASYITQGPNRAANCAALIPGVPLPLPTPNLNAPVIYGGGNSALRPESSNSFTIGTIIQPRFLRGFDMTVDLWDIKIDNAITSLPYTTLLNNCVDSSGGPNQVYCGLITRNAQGNVTSVQASFQNLASQHARGIDFGLNYRTPVGSGLFRASLNGTYLLKQLLVAQAGKTGVDYVGEWDNPRFKATLLTEFTHGKVTLGVNTRFISRSLYAATQTSSEQYQYPHIPAYVYNDITVTVRPTQKFNISAGVKNVSNVQVPFELRQFNYAPHLSGSNFGVFNAAGGYYDVIGRYFFVKVGIDL